MVRAAARLCSALLCAGAVGSSVWADEVTLNDGRVLEGEVTSKAGTDPVDLKTTVGGITVIRHFPASQIARISFGQTARQTAIEAILAERRQLGDQGTGEQYWALVERARESGDTLLARDLAAEVVVHDRQHAAARKMLGMVQYRGVWMRANEAATARGEVVYNGRWMTWDERDRQQADQARREQEAASAQRAYEQARRDAAAAASVGDGLAPPTVVPGYNPAYGPGYGGPTYGPYGPYGNGGYYRGVRLCPPFVQGRVIVPPPNGVIIRAGGGTQDSSFTFNWGF